MSEVKGLLCVFKAHWLDGLHNSQETWDKESGPNSVQMLSCCIFFSPFPNLTLAKGSYPFICDFSKGSVQSHVQTCFL